jgi:uncharacterized protein (TIGR00106 family)
MPAMLRAYANAEGKNKHLMFSVFYLLEGVMRMVVIVKFNIIPLGVGVSISMFLVPAIEELEKRKVKYDISSMGTIFEAKNVEEAFKLVRAAHESVFKLGVKRVVTAIRIDDRRDDDRSMEGKVKSLKTLVKKA